jgi:single-stranded DNA-binding protein
MNAVWRRGRHVFFGLMLVLSFGFALFVPTSSAQARVAGPVPFEGRYYNNTTLSGTPVLTRTDQAINFAWGYGSPAPRVHADRFSARWVQTAFFQEGTYRFTVTADDGVRLFVDGRVVIDQWHDQAATQYSVNLPLSGSAAHTIRMEYYERSGHATAILNWERVNTANAFMGAYYPNTTLSGTPARTRMDPAINFDWGYGSPFPAAIGRDNFSVRWTRTISLATGQYRFVVTADDGVRLYLDGKLIIDKWQDQGTTTYTSIKMLNAGTHTIKMEYYERYGNATARLNWQPISSGGGYVGVYYDNMTLSGTPTQMRIDPSVNFNWGSGSPDPTISADQFSARWIRNVRFDNGFYRFTVTADDGVRLFVDGAPIIDRWQDQPAAMYSRNIRMTQGVHEIVMEYYEHSGAAIARLIFQRIGG